MGCRGISGPISGASPQLQHGVVGPSHNLQFLMSCSSVDLFHGVQSYRSSLLQFGSLMELQVLPTNLFQHGLFSPHLHGSLPGAYSISGLPWLSLHQAHLCQCGPLHGLHMDFCFHIYPSTGSISLICAHTGVPACPVQQHRKSSSAPTICQSLCITIAVLKMSPSTAQ